MTTRTAGTAGRDQERIDAEALALRQSGKTFVAITRALHLSDSQVAHDCFVRGLRRHPPARQRRLRDDELERLRDLEIKVRGNPELSPFDRDRQLDVVRTLRLRLLRP